MLFSMIIPVALFVVLLLIFLIRFKVGMKPILIGAGVFLVFALILEGLFNRALLVWCQPTAVFFKDPLALGIYGAIAAAVFEETGRLVGMKLFYKERTRWKHGMAYGIGHGGLEVLTIGGLVALTEISNLAYSFMINSGTYGELLNQFSGAPDTFARLEEAKEQLISLPAWQFFVSGLERVDAFVIQLALSLLVLYAVSRRRALFFCLALLLHALVDFTGPFMNLMGANTLAIEGVITVYAALAAVFIVFSKGMFRNYEAALPCTEKDQPPEAGQPQ